MSARDDRPAGAVREPVVSVLLDPDWASGSLVDDVRRGLASQPRTLPPKWLYDDAGSALFDEITRLPEYYPFAAEHSILEAHAEEIAGASGATTLVELGSGTSDKTRLLLDAFTATGQLTRFAPVDVSEGTLRDAASRIAGRDLGTFFRSWLYGEKTPPMPGHPDWQTVAPVEAPAKVADKVAAKSPAEVSGGRRAE